MDAKLKVEPPKAQRNNRLKGPKDTDYEVDLSAYHTLESDPTFKNITVQSKTNNIGYDYYACANHPSYVALDY